jgi:hypothetical protein
MTYISAHSQQVLQRFLIFLTTASILVDSKTAAERSNLNITQNQQKYLPLPQIYEIQAILTTAVNLCKSMLINIVVKESYK